jgi:hypothetical protein
VCHSELPVCTWLPSEEYAEISRFVAITQKVLEIAQRFDVLPLWFLLDCECRNSVVPVKILCWLSNVAECVLFVSDPTRHVNTFCLHVSCGNSIAGVGIHDHDNKWILRADSKTTIRNLTGIISTDTKSRTESSLGNKRDSHRFRSYRTAERSHKRIRHAKVRNPSFSLPHNNGPISLVTTKWGYRELNRQLEIQQMRRVIANFKLFLHLHDINSGIFLK